MVSTKEMSSFARAAIALDSDFQALEGLSGQLERCSLESDQDFEHARKLLSLFGECGQRIGGGVQTLAQELEQARVRAEAAAQVVGERSIVVEQRHEASQKVLESFQALASKARGLTEAMQVLKQQDRALVLERLPGLLAELDGLSADVTRLEEDALQQGLKSMAKNAGSMRQSLQAARERLRA